MSQERWNEVDAYLTKLLVDGAPSLEDTLRASTRAGLPDHHVSPTQGKLLHLLARIGSVGRILEIGTLGGYSTGWLARALPPGGRLITLEADSERAEVARSNLAAAGLADRVEVRVGPALQTLPQLDREGRAPFDLFFIDADKVHNADYFDWALRLSRPGSLMIFDNVVRAGAVADAGSTDPDVLGVRRLMGRLAAEPRVQATAIQTVGSKGYDGFALVLVTASAAGESSS